MLTIQPQEAFWADIAPGVRLRFRPITPRLWRGAWRVVREAMADPDADDEALGDALSRELIVGGVEAWEGIGNAAGEPVDPSREMVSAFLDTDPRYFEACDRAYVMPFVLRDAEKNGSAASPAGIGEAATPEADTAS